jgi:hypothetical protein
MYRHMHIYVYEYVCVCVGLFVDVNACVCAVCDLFIVFYLHHFIMSKVVNPVMKNRLCHVCLEFVMVVLSLLLCIEMKSPLSSPISALLYSPVLSFPAPCSSFAILFPLSVLSPLSLYSSFSLLPSLLYSSLPLFLSPLLYSQQHSTIQHITT